MAELSCLLAHDFLLDSDDPGLLSFFLFESYGVLLFQPFNVLFSIKWFGFSRALLISAGSVKTLLLEFGDLCLFFRPFFSFFLFVGGALDLGLLFSQLVDLGLDLSEDASEASSFTVNHGVEYLVPRDELLFNRVVDFKSREELFELRFCWGW